MGIYFKFWQKAFKQNYVYRANTYLYIISAIFGLVVDISIWKALYKNKTTVDGIALIDMMTFVIISMAVSTLTYSSLGNKLAGKIKDGSISSDFVRPISLKYYMVAEEFGDRTYSMVFTFLPVCIVTAFLVPFRLPGSFTAFALFLLSLFLGIILMYYIHYTLGLLAFWFKNAIYVNWFLGAFFTLFGGTAVPLWFYPEFLKNIANVLPFKFVSFEPISIFLGKVDLNGAITIIISQFIWIAVFAVLESFVWNRAQKVVTIQGG